MGDMKLKRTGLIKIFPLAFALLLTACDDYNYVIVNHGINFISKDGVKVIPNYILEYKRGDHHIAVSRLKVNGYRCESKAFRADGYYSTEIIKKDIEYRVINTDTGRVYKTENRDEYIRYLSKHKIKHLLTTGRFEDALFRKNENLKELFEQRNANTEKRILMGICKRTS